VSKNSWCGELIIDQLVGFFVVEPIYTSLSPRLGTGARIFSGFILGFNGAMLSVAGNILVNCETPVVTSLNSSEMLIEIGFAYRGEHMHVVDIYAVLCNSQKKIMVWQYVVLLNRLL
jgi:hypothetical protein